MSSPVRFAIVHGTDPEAALKQLHALDVDGDGVPDQQQRQASLLTCTGCGEQYDEHHIEGSLHDHWTAAEHTASNHDTGVVIDLDARRYNPAHLSAYAMGLARQAATFNRTKAPAKPVNDWDKDVMHAVTKDRGFSFHNAVGDGPSGGYMVSIAKHTEVKVPLRDLTSAQVADYMSLHQQDLRDPRNYLGGWVYKGMVYLDVSRHVDSREEAMRLAREHQQLAIYDIAAGDTLMTEPEQEQKAAFVVSRVPRFSGKKQAAQQEAYARSFVTALQRAAMQVISDDDSAYCRKCGRDDLPIGQICRRPGSPFEDLGADRDREEEPSRYEGICLRCCGHNHG